MNDKAMLVGPYLAPGVFGVQPDGDIGYEVRWNPGGRGSTGPETWCLFVARNFDHEDLYRIKVYRAKTRMMVASWSIKGTSPTKSGVMPFGRVSHATAEKIFAAMFPASLSAVRRWPSDRVNQLLGAATRFERKAAALRQEADLIRVAHALHEAPAASGAARDA